MIANTTSQTNCRAAADELLTAGIVPIPLRPGGKQPAVGCGWQSLTAEDVRRDFDKLFPPGGNYNVGILLGAPSGGLVDVDLDCHEARVAAEMLLPPTDMIWGRQSCAGRSHYGYRVSDPPAKATHPYSAPEGGRLLELRSTGGQTVAPPSILPGKNGHPDEPCVWARRGAPAEVSAVAVREACDKVAAAALLARHYPQRGQRHDFCLALAGGLLRAGWTPTETERFLWAVCAAAGDEEVHDRLKGVQTTAAALQRGARPTGWPTVIRILGSPGEGIVAKVRDWLSLSGDLSTDDVSQGPEDCQSSRRAEELVYRPFPTEALPEPMRSLVTEGAQALGCDPAFLAVPALAAAAGCIGNARVLCLKPGWDAKAILWGAIIAESGSLKTPAAQLVLGPLQQQERAWYAAWKEAMKEYRRAQKVYERDLAAWKRSKGALPPAEPEKPVCRRVTVTDVTAEKLIGLLEEQPKGLLLLRDELSGWLASLDRYAKNRGTSADAAFYLSAHSAAAHRYDRKTTGESIYLTRPAVSIFGGIQPVVLRTALGQEHVHNGLLARLLVATPPRHAKRWTEARVSEHTLQNWAEVLQRLTGLCMEVSSEGTDEPVRLGMTPEAKAIWVAYYDAHAGEWLQADGELASASSKLEEGAARLALALHLVRVAAGDPAADPKAVDAWSMQAGVTLARWFWHEAKRLYDGWHASPEDANRRRLIEWIERRGGSVSLRELQRGPRWLREPGAAEAALEELCRCGLGYWKVEPPPASGGHAQRVFVLATGDTRPKIPEKNDRVSPALNANPTSEGGDNSLPTQNMGSPNIVATLAQKSLEKPTECRLSPLSPPSTCDLPPGDSEGVPIDGGLSDSAEVAFDAAEGGSGLDPAVVDQLFDEVALADDNDDGVCGISEGG